jgi:hypothetical protein
LVRPAAGERVDEGERQHQLVFPDAVDAVEHAQRGLG